jgi:hypothetical protein
MREAPGPARGNLRLLSHIFVPSAYGDQEGTAYNDHFGLFRHSLSVEPTFSLRRIQGNWVDQQEMVARFKIEVL